jgi:hypothetical protein
LFQASGFTPQGGNCPAAPRRRDRADKGASSAKPANSSASVKGSGTVTTSVPASA